MANETANTNLLELASELAMAWLANPNTHVAAEDVPVFLQTMHTALSDLGAPVVSVEERAPASEFMRAVSVRRSLASKDHIISMIDGKPYKSLKRHLGGKGLTPQQYRERYGLKPDYPMVAENYAAFRRSLAKKIGLGRKPGEKVTKPKAVRSKAPASPKA